MISIEEVSSSLYKALEKIGLNKQERKLYALSLNLGPATVSQLAEHLHIARPNVYKLIKPLETKGLANFSGKMFMVEPPNIVLELIRKQQKDWESIDQSLASDMPSLLSIYQQGELPTKVKIYRGKKQFDNLFFQIFEEANQDILLFGNVAELVSSFPLQFWHSRIDLRIHKKIWVKALLVEQKAYNPKFVTNKHELRESRILDKALTFVPAFHLFGNKMVLWQPKAKMALLVEDEYIVDMHRQIFRLLWEQSTPR